MTLLAILAAIYGASILGCWALWVCERRAWDAHTADGLAHAANSRAVTWLCPWCEDQVHAGTVPEMWDGAHEHMALCAFYRVSGSWEAVA